MKIKIDYLNRNIIIGLVFLIIIVLLLLSSPLLPKISIYGWLVAIFPLGLVVRFLLRRTKKFTSGFIGEKDVEVELKSLGTDFICINGGLDTGRGNIDKIVLGPTGIWTLEVKSQKGNITFEKDTLLNWGKPLEKDFLEQAYAEAKTLEEFIKVRTVVDIKVQPVLVFSNKFTKVRLGTKPYKGVYVVQRAWLNKLITETHIHSMDETTAFKIKGILDAA